MNLKLVQSDQKPVLPLNVVTRSSKKQHGKQNPKFKDIRHENKANDKRVKLAALAGMHAICFLKCLRKP